MSLRTYDVVSNGHKTRMQLSDADAAAMGVKATAVPDTEPPLPIPEPPNAPKPLPDPEPLRTHEPPDVPKPVETKAHQPAHNKARTPHR